LAAVTAASALRLAASTAEELILYKDGVVSK
jgi:hypothetical protein